MNRWLEGLTAAVEGGDRAGADRVFAEAIPSFRKVAREASGNVVDLAAARMQS